MKVFEYLSYLITGILICVAIFYWVKNRVKPWRLIGFRYDSMTLFDIIAAFYISGISVSCIFLVEKHLGLVEIQTAKIDYSIFIGFLIFLLLAAFIEEFLNRGLMVNGLAVILTKKWQIVIIVSLLFGLGHITGEGVSIISIINNAIGGAIYTFVFLTVKNLWLPWALHFSWNSFQYVLGYPVSGLKIDSIITLTEVKDTIFTGGKYGPEGGLIGLFFRFVFLLLILTYLCKCRQINIKSFCK